MGFDFIENILIPFLFFYGFMTFLASMFISMSSMSLGEEYDIKVIWKGYLTRWEGFNIMAHYLFLFFGLGTVVVLTIFYYICWSLEKTFGFLLLTKEERDKKERERDE